MHGGTVPNGCMPTADPTKTICISNNLVSSYGTASQCAACTEKGLTNACVDVDSCVSLFTMAIVEELYLLRTHLKCTAQPLQPSMCGWGEIMTPNYQAVGECPTPQECTSINWANCATGIGAFDAYVYGVCNLP